MTTLTIMAITPNVVADRRAVAEGLAVMNSGGGRVIFLAAPS